MQLAPLAGKQRDAVRLCQSRFNIFEGSVRSGKTISSLLAWLKFVRTGPPGNLLMAARTSDALKRNCIEPLVEMLGPTRCVHNIGTRELHLLGRTVYLASANDDRSATKIAGLTLAGAYGDELSTWPESFFRMLTSRLSIANSKLFGTTNPDSPLCWLKTDYLDKARVHLTGAGAIRMSEDDRGLDLARLSFVLTDNPHLPADYVKSLEAEYSGLWRKRYVEGLWVIAEGAVFDMFDPQRHVVDVCPVIKRWLAVAVDHGTKNPFAAIVLGLGTDRRLYAVAEWYWDSEARHRQLTDGEYSVKLREFLQSVRYPGSQMYGVRPERIIVDPSALGFIRQLHNDITAGREGISVMGADNAVLDGIRTVSSLMASGRFLIHSSCKNLIDQMQSYCWDEKAAKKGEDRPVKVNDHAVDACRYAVQTTRQAWRNMIVPPDTSPNYEDHFPVAL